jgi:hypothetical protein
MQPLLELLGRLAQDPSAQEMRVWVTLELPNTGKEASEVTRPTVGQADEGPFDLANPPDLTHTKLNWAKFDGKEYSGRVHHNTIKAYAIRKVADLAGLDVEGLRQELRVNVIRGRQTAGGWRYDPDVDLSVQDQDANRAWRTIYLAARLLGVQVDAMFHWLEKDGAAYPGEARRGTIGS